MVELRTDRLLLRRARMDDVATFAAIFRDPEAMLYWSFAPHDRLQQSRDWVASMVAGHTDGSDDFVIALGGRAIGKMGAYRLPEFGFILARDHWGQGYASEALAAFVLHRRAVDPGGLLTADVDPRNARSLRLLERHGFAETGRAANTWNVGGEWHDSVYLELRF